MIKSVTAESICLPTDSRHPILNKVSQSIDDF